MTEIITAPESVRRMLHELGIHINHNGYRRLCLGIPHYAQNPEQSLTKELYPYIARAIGNTSAVVVETAIRRAILYGWQHSDRDPWIRYFGYISRVPTNLTFIATLAEHL
jgi:hypothetical protein